ncbi:uncharacterized protein LOC116263591 [Nymphaea colorata]|uniref:Uncharacterized protein n=1 Tax=Nymphaea colorata TaxID=210225 RepID=A0A5K0Y0W0_9MAGN|nr:uncharacterized protein LOC116263591 [Nymphaea colorata]
MAIEILFDNSDWSTVPRLSFSGDLSLADRFDDDHREDSSLLQSPSSDFCFCVPQQNCSSSADQLFSNGKILPLAPLCAPPRRFSPPFLRKESLQEVPDRSKKPAPTTEASKSFWCNFGRSSSLNCRSITKSAFLCSLSRLTRSQSVGTSTTEVASKKAAAAAAVPPASAKPGKRPTRKKKEHNNGVKVKPVLNVPTPYISRGKSSLFSFGFFLCRKEKNRKACF